jgi:transketolase
MIVSSNLIPSNQTDLDWFPTRADWQQKGRLSLAPEVLELVVHSLRRAVVHMVARQGQGYVQQGLGAAEIFASLYFHEMYIEPQAPTCPTRDRFLLSTAHNSALFHATLALRGMIDAKKLNDYVKDGSTLEINVSERLGPIVEGTFGSLGQGPSVACGLAMSDRIKGRKNRTYLVLGDGELQEGQVWEAAMFAGSEKLSNLCIVLDLNWLQVEGHSDSVLKMNPIPDKWRAFGWNVIEVDGNHIGEMLNALHIARQHTQAPTLIVATTILGKGAKILENVFSHNAKLSQETARTALLELGDYQW